MRWSLETLGGDTLKSGQETAVAGPLQSTPIQTLNFADQLTEANRRDLIFVAELWQGDKRVSLGVSPFVADKHLSLIDPGLDIAESLQNDQLVFAVSAKSLARFVELSLEGVDVVFSDNYFDVPVGRTIGVSCPLPEGWTVGQAQNALTVQSLYNSFA